MFAKIWLDGCSGNCKGCYDVARCSDNVRPKTCNKLLSLHLWYLLTTRPQFPKHFQWGKTLEFGSHFFGSDEYRNCRRKSKTLRVWAHSLSCRWWHAITYIVAKVPFTKKNWFPWFSLISMIFSFLNFHRKGESAASHTPSAILYLPSLWSGCVSAVDFLPICTFCLGTGSTVVWTGFRFHCPRVPDMCFYSVW